MLLLLYLELKIQPQLNSILIPPHVRNAVNSSTEMNNAASVTNADSNAMAGGASTASSDSSGQGAAAAVASTVATNTA